MWSASDTVLIPVDYKQTDWSWKNVQSTGLNCLIQYWLTDSPVCSLSLFAWVSFMIEFKGQDEGLQLRYIIKPNAAEKRSLSRLNS